MNERKIATVNNSNAATAFINLKVTGKSKDDIRSFKTGISLYANREMDQYLMDNPKKIQELFAKNVEATLVFANGSKDDTKEFSL